jgi:hypothetical protein
MAARKHRLEQRGRLSSGQFRPSANGAVQIDGNLGATAGQRAHLVAKVLVQLLLG